MKMGWKTRPLRRAFSFSTTSLAREQLVQWLRTSVQRHWQQTKCIFRNQSGWCRWHAFGRHCLRWTSAMVMVYVDGNIVKLTAYFSPLWSWVFPFSQVITGSGWPTTRARSSAASPHGTRSGVCASRIFGASSITDLSSLPRTRFTEVWKVTHFECPNAWYTWPPPRRF